MYNERCVIAFYDRLYCYRMTILKSSDSSETPTIIKICTKPAVMEKVTKIYFFCLKKTNWHESHCQGNYKKFVGWADQSPPFVDIKTYVAHLNRRSVENVQTQAKGHGTSLWAARLRLHTRREDREKISGELAQDRYAWGSTFRDVVMPAHPVSGNYRLKTRNGFPIALLDVLKFSLELSFNKYA